MSKKHRHKGPKWVRKMLRRLVKAELLRRQ